ncbi:MAG: tetratricopeptide repeat protein [Pseudomonadota bacterium]
MLVRKVSLKSGLFAGLFMSVLMPASPAMAASDIEQCLGRTAALERIGSCSRAIDAGLSGKQLVDAYASRGVTYRQLGQLDNAIADLTTALDNDKGNVNIHIARARALFNKRDYDRAMLDLAEAIKLDPQNSVPVNLMGKNHFMLANYDIALKFFGEAIELDPNDYNAFVNRATTYYRTNKLPEAMKDVNAAYLMLPPGDSRGRALLQLKVAIERAFASQQGAAPASN